MELGTPVIAPRKSFFEDMLIDSDLFLVDNHDDPDEWILKMIEILKLEKTGIFNNQTIYEKTLRDLQNFVKTM
jgi:glycosyltransferase involved in cell wall biosynthesis